MVSRDTPQRAANSPILSPSLIRPIPKIDLGASSKVKSNLATRGARRAASGLHAPMAVGIPETEGPLPPRAHPPRGPPRGAFPHGPITPPRLTERAPPAP